MGSPNNVFRIEQYRKEQSRIAGMGAHQVDRYAQSDADAQRFSAARSHGGPLPPNVTFIQQALAQHLHNLVNFADVDDRLKRPHPAPMQHVPQETNYSPALWETLASLESHGASSAVAGKALSTWARLAQMAPPEPEIELPDGAVRFTWSFEELYLHLDVQADGFSWFFEDDRAQVDGGTRTASEPAIPDAFFVNLSRLRVGT